MSCPFPEGTGEYDDALASVSRPRAATRSVMTDDTPHSPPPSPDATVMVPRTSGGNDPVMARLIEATAGQYRVDRELGRGGMAAVYLGHDLSLDRQVAIKVMSPELFDSGKEMVDRFLREARTGARLNHPHIIPVYAVREEQDLIFFVMKFIDGKALDAVVKKAGPLPIPVVARVMSQAADALAYAHRSGIIHRDIKPSNLMLDKEGWIVVTDLGIAKVQDSQALTATGSAMGTPTYMSPEQSMGSRTTTAASDQYSLGCVAYELLTGRPPFQGDSVVSLIFQHHADPPPPIHPLRPDVPAELASTVMRMLEKAPEDRFSDLDEVARIFRGFGEADEEWMRLVLRGYATGATTAAGGAPVRAAASMSSGARAATVRMARPGTATPTSTPVPAIPSATSMPSISVPAAPPPTPAAQLPRWKRVFLKQDGASTRLRTPKLRYVALSGFLLWVGCFPRPSGLETTMPSVTALMRMREDAAEAAVRRNQVRGRGPCDGIRKDLASCRTYTPVPLTAIAPAMLEATRLAQDPMFRERRGLDWGAMRRALGYPRDAFDAGNSVDRSDLFAVLPRLRQRMDVVGRTGSLYQQLAQQLWLPADASMLRKVRELFAARRLARAITPDRALELYLNTAEYGTGLFGIEAAAQAYYGVPAQALTRAQAAELAATLTTPRSSTPTESPAEMKARAGLLLRAMDGDSVAIPRPYERVAPEGR